MELETGGTGWGGYEFFFEGGRLGLGGLESVERTKNQEKCRKKRFFCTNIWSVQKNVVSLHAFSGLSEPRTCIYKENRHGNCVILTVRRA